MQDDKSVPQKTSDSDPIVYAEWKHANQIVRIEVSPGGWIVLVTYAPKGNHGKLVPKTFFEIPREAVPMLREGLGKLEAALSA
jgi:hypothetical protein